MTRLSGKRLQFAALLVLTLLVSTGCVAARMGVSWPSVSLVGDNQYIMVAHGIGQGSFLVQIDPADGSEVKLRDSEGKVRVDPETGEARSWEILESAGQNFHTAPVLVEDNILLAAEYGKKFVEIDYAAARIDNPTGVQISGQPVADFVIDEEAERVYLGYNSTNLEAFDLDTLDLLWTFETQSGVWSKPLLHEGVLYVTSMDHFLYAIDPADGSLNWKIDLDGAAAGTPLLVNDRLYVGTFARTIVEVSLEGEQTALYTAENWVWGSPVSDGSTLYAADLSGFTYALSVPGLQEEWKVQAAPDGIRPSPLLIDDALVVVSRTGKVAWLNPATGTEFQTRQVDNEILSELLYVPSGQTQREPLVVVTGVNPNPMMVAFTASDGQRVWEYSR
jgi:outer membrane protein assembly factor BamB